MQEKITLDNQNQYVTIKSQNIKEESYKALIKVLSEIICKRIIEEKRR